MVRAEFPEVTAIRSERNLGFAGGNNLALREIVAHIPARRRPGPRVHPADQHRSLHGPRHDRDAGRFHGGAPEVGIVGPRVEKRDGSLDLACRRTFPTPANAFFKLFGLSRRFPGHARLADYNLTHLDPGQLTEVDAVMGACMLVRLSAIDAGCGLLDETFFMYGEDLDWAYRIKARAGRSSITRRRACYTRRAPPVRGSSWRMIVEFYRAMYLFYRKHYAPRSPRPVNWLVAVGSPRAARSRSGQRAAAGGRKRVA